MTLTSTEPKITLIIPCYNCDKYIDRCMTSVEEQTIGIHNMQIVLIDDASLDSTLDKLLIWQAKYPGNIEIISNPKNRRQGTCRNLGLMRANGEYVAFLDADDWIEPDMYEKLLTVAEIGACDLVCCESSQDKEYKCWSKLREKYTGKLDRLIEINTEEDRSNLIASNLLKTYVVTKLYRKEFITKNQIRFPQDLIFEDIFWMGLLNCYATKIGMVEERLYHYYMNPESVSRIKNKEQNKDIMEVNRRLWAEYEKRGFLKTGIKEALSYDILCTYYLTTAKMLFLRYDKLPYEWFYEMQHDVLNMVPDYATNEKIQDYINTYTTTFNVLLLGLLDKKLSIEDIDSAALSMRTLAKLEETKESQEEKI